jgi:hypothetical protein
VNVGSDTRLVRRATFTIEKGLGDPFINIAQVKAVARES